MKIRLDLPPEMAKHTARLVKMNNNARVTMGKNHVTLVQLKMVFPVIK